MSLKCLLGLRTVWIWFSVGPRSSSTTFSKINKTPQVFKDFLDTGRHAGKMREIQKERMREGNAAKDLACLDFKLGNCWSNLAIILNYVIRKCVRTRPNGAEIHCKPSVCHNNRYSVLQAAFGCWIFLLLFVVCFIVTDGLIWLFCFVLDFFCLIVLFQCHFNQRYVPLRSKQWLGRSNADHSGCRGRRQQWFRVTIQP